jgi:hypothetical protein
MFYFLFFILILIYIFIFPSRLSIRRTSQDFGHSLASMEGNAPPEIASCMPPTFSFFHAPPPSKLAKASCCHGGGRQTE